MSERFHIESPPVDGRVVLAGEEARHLGRVLRGRVGDRVTLFDGTGGSWPGRVERVDRDTILVATGPRAESVEPRLRLTVAAALPKGDRQKWMIEKLTELGCWRFIPLGTSRSVAEGTSSAVTRLRRNVIEACKQCGRDRLMAVDESRGLADLIADDRAGHTMTIVADPDGVPLGSLAENLSSGDVLAVVGPEGGLDDDERQALETAGFCRVAIGQHILRVETAAVAVAAVIAAGGRR